MHEFKHKAITEWGCFDRRLKSALAVLFISLNVCGDSLDNWTTLQNQNPTQPTRLMSVAFGGGKFIAVGLSFGTNNASSSVNGESWQPLQIGGQFDSGWEIIYANERFVALVGPSIYTSQDGLAWKGGRVPGTAGADIPEQAAYDHGLFLACDYWHKTTWASADGEHWTQSIVDPSGLLRLWSLAGGNGVFVSIYQDASYNSPPQLFVTTNGTAWAAVSGAPSLASVAFLNGRFVGVTTGFAGKYYSSTNGIDWIPQGNAIDLEFNAPISYGNNDYITASFNRTYVSSNLTTWTQSPNYVYQISSIAYGNGVFAAISSGGVLSSSDGLTWHSPIANSTLQSAAYGAGKFVTAGSSESGQNRFSGYSVDSTNLTVQSFAISSLRQTRASVLFGADLFVGFTDAGEIFSSTDGLAWKSSFTPAAGQAWYSGVFANGGFYIYGKAGVMGSSSNGLDWSISTGSSIPSLDVVTYGNHAFVGIGGNALFRSGDGRNWTRVPVPSPAISVAFGNGVFLAGGGSVRFGGRSAAFVSSDGSLWRETVLVPISSVIYGNGRFLVFGSSVFETLDGELWTQHGGSAALYGTFGNSRFFGGGRLQFMTVSDPTTPAYHVSAEDAK